MAEEKGVKETKEALKGLFAVAACIAVQLKDGLQIGEDVGALLIKWQTDAEFRKKLEEAVRSIDQVPAEIGDIDLSEGFELSREALDGAQLLLAALKSTPSA